MCVTSLHVDYLISRFFAASSVALGTELDAEVELAVRTDTSCPPKRSIIKLHDSIDKDRFRMGTLNV